MITSCEPQAAHNNFLPNLTQISASTFSPTFTILPKARPLPSPRSFCQIDLRFQDSSRSSTLPDKIIIMTKIKCAATVFPARTQHHYLLPVSFISPYSVPIFHALHCINQLASHWKQSTSSIDVSRLSSLQTRSYLLQLLTLHPILSRLPTVYQKVFYLASLGITENFAFSNLLTCTHLVSCIQFTHFTIPPPLRALFIPSSSCVGFLLIRTYHT